MPEMVTGVGDVIGADVLLLPVIPVSQGNPMAFVSVTLAGMPNIGATKASVVPSVVAPVIPPNAPALLY